jgi:type II secretory pathway component PulF
LQLKTFTYIYMSADRVRRREEIQAESKEDAYIRLRKKKIRPIRVLAEGEAEPPPKNFMSRAAKQEENPEPSVADRLRRLNALKDEGLISEAEYAEQRAKIISTL